MNSKERKSRSKSASGANKNALIHGVYSRDVVLPWESRADFEDLFRSLCAELGPHGRLEEECVVDVAHLRWQKQRIRKMWHAAAYEDPFVLDLIESGKKTWKGMRDYLRKQSLNSRTLTAPMREIFAQLTRQAQEAASKLTSNDDDAKEAHEQLRFLLQAIDERVLPLLRQLALAPNAEQSLKNTYSPSNLEPILRLEASIDGRIDKALGRLANLKAFKALNREPALLEYDKKDR
jgi:hypothetical protein